MIRRAQIFFLSFSLLLQGALFANFADAAEAIKNPIKAESFADIAKSIAKYAREIGVTIGVIVILYAAFLFMTSAGDVEKVKKAKRALIWALVGIAIVLIGEGFIDIIKDALKAR